MWEDTDNDFLRLWVCLRSVPASSEQPMEEASGNNYMTFIFSATVTSNLAEYHPMEGAEITADTGKLLSCQWMMDEPTPAEQLEEALSEIQETLPNQTVKNIWEFWVMLCNLAPAVKEILNSSRSQPIL